MLPNKNRKQVFNVGRQRVGSAGRHTSFRNLPHGSLSNRSLLMVCGSRTPEAGISNQDPLGPYDFFMFTVPILCGLKLTVLRRKEKKVGQLTLDLGLCRHSGMYPRVSRTYG